MLGQRERMKENGRSPGPGEAERSAAARGRDAEVVDKPMRRRLRTSARSRAKWAAFYGARDCIRKAWQHVAKRPETGQ
jgi:hypothetical protein